APSPSDQAPQKYRESLRTPNPPPAVYELAFIGAGSTTAYYIDTLGPDHDHSTTLLFGDPTLNPWAGQRGFSIEFINHVRRQIDLPSRKVAAPAPSTGRTTAIFVGRPDFAEDAAKTIAKAIPETNCIKPAIKQGADESERGITRTGGIYHIETVDGKVYKAKSVIFAAGAGGHKAPIYKASSGPAKSYEVDAAPNLRG